MPTHIFHPLRRLAVAAVTIGLAATLFGCTQPDPTPSESAITSAVGPTQFTDDLNNPVVVKSTGRVVACMGSFANMWELAGGHLIAVSDDAFDQYTITSPDVELIGDFSSPDIEKILALEPDFVIMTGASGGRGGGVAQTDLKPTLDKAGIPVAYFTVTTFSDYLRVMKIMTTITGRPDLYEKYGTDVQSQIDDIIAKVPDTSTQQTVALMTTYSQGTVVQDSSTMTGAMLSDLKAANLADVNQSLLHDFSLEGLINANPAYILVVPMGNDTAAAMAALEAQTKANPAWATLDAVKNDKYVILEPRLFLYKPNADWAQSYQTLFDILYG